jgi:hypothetical protein
MSPRANPDTRTGEGGDPMSPGGESRGRDRRLRREDHEVAASPCGCGFRSRLVDDMTSNLDGDAVVVALLRLSVVVAVVVVNGCCCGCCSAVVAARMRLLLWLSMMHAVVVIDDACCCG